MNNFHHHFTGGLISYKSTLVAEFRLSQPEQ